MARAGVIFTPIIFPLSLVEGCFSGALTYQNLRLALLCGQAGSHSTGPRAGTGRCALLQYECAGECAGHVGRAGLAPAVTLT